MLRLNDCFASCVSSLRPLFTWEVKAASEPAFSAGSPLFQRVLRDSSGDKTLLGGQGTHVKSPSIPLFKGGSWMEIFILL
jgi:hypothetical protein